jgi:AhpD family alkylhydroperoxidase
LAILTVAATTQCDFVATQHVPISEQAGVNEETHQLIRKGTTPNAV